MPKAKKGQRFAFKDELNNKREGSRIRGRPADGAPEDLGRGAEVDGTVRRLGVHALAKEPHVLHFLADEATGHANLFAADRDDFLSVEELLGHDRSQPPQHVVACVHHHSLRADSRSRHHY